MQNTIENNISHQDIGKKLELFFMDDVSPGSCFFLPKGQYLYNRLVELMRKLYEKYGYDEVGTPIMCKSELWKKSGHLEKYQENMYFIDDKEDEDNLDNKCGICPMNCPKHIKIFEHIHPSYKDLPVRLSDFGALHRKEPSGSLRGLRMFHQDDGHVFCMRSQINDEISSILEMMKYVYNLFGFEYDIAISTRPDNFIGDIDLWNEAEEILKNNASLLGEYHLKEGDGAFYGPKIDVMVKDSLGRKHQLGTIQLDFVLPQRFSLQYQGKSQMETPVMIHRAIFGSLERFIAILLEHTSGRLPLWLSPRKIALIPVSDKFNDYCNTLLSTFQSLLGFKGIDIISHDKVNINVAFSESLKYNYILVIGKKELDSSTISYRSSHKINTLPLSDFCKLLSSSNSFL